MYVSVYKYASLQVATYIVATDAEMERSHVTRAIKVVSVFVGGCAARRTRHPARAVSARVVVGFAMTETTCKIEVVQRRSESLHVQAHTSEVAHPAPALTW